MNNYMKTIISGLKQWVSSQKSDWNQNDSSAANYVKNRTHYTDVGEVEVLSKTTYDDRTGITLKTPFVGGKTYTVLFNDVTYECVAKYYDDYIMIGNNAIYEYDNGDETDTGEPFAIGCAVGDTYANVYFSDDATSTPTLRITTTGEVVHKLDKKYLPDLHYIEYNKSQTLTDEQMQMARENIGAGTSNFSGSYADLTNKPTIYTDVVRYNTSQSLTSTQKSNVKTNIGIGSFDGSYSSLTGKPTMYNDVVRYGNQTLSTAQKTQARSNIGATDFSGRYIDLIDAPEYVPNYDSLKIASVDTEGISIHDDKDGDTKTTAFASWSPTTWFCNPDGQDGTKTSSATWGFGKRDDDIILKAYYGKSNGSVLTSQDIQITGVAAPTADNDVANKAYIDGLVGDTKVSEQINTAIESSNKANKINDELPVFWSGDYFQISEDSVKNGLCVKIDQTNSSGNNEGLYGITAYIGMTDYSTGDAPLWYNQVDTYTFPSTIYVPCDGSVIVGPLTDWEYWGTEYYYQFSRVADNSIEIYDVVNLDLEDVRNEIPKAVRTIGDCQESVIVDSEYGESYWQYDLTDKNTKIICECDNYGTIYLYNPDSGIEMTCDVKDYSKTKYVLPDDLYYGDLKSPIDENWKANTNVSVSGGTWNKITVQKYNNDLACKVATLEYKVEQLTNTVDTLMNGEW